MKWLQHAWWLALFCYIALSLVLRWIRWKSKGLAAWSSRKRPYNIQSWPNGHQLFFFAQTALLSVNFYYATSYWLWTKAIPLSSRLDMPYSCWNSPTSLHLPDISRVGTSEKAVQQSESKVEHVLESSPDNLSIQFAHMKGHLTATYDSRWWLGCVLHTYPELNEVEAKFLYPDKSSRSFCYPRPNGILTISCLDVLTTNLLPTTSNGRHIH